MVLGIPDETVGERVGLVIVPQEGADLGENPRRTMHEFFTSKKLADFKIPERVQVLQECPPRTWVRFLAANCAPSLPKFSAKPFELIIFS